MKVVLLSLCLSLIAALLIPAGIAAGVVTVYADAPGGGSRSKAKISRDRQG